MRIQSQFETSLKGVCNLFLTTAMTQIAMNDDRNGAYYDDLDLIVAVDNKSPLVKYLSKMLEVYLFR